jgi:hypothetical protein
MKLVGVLSTTVLSLTLGVGIPAFAQQEQHDQQEEQKAKPPQEKEKKAQPEKPVKQGEKDVHQQDAHQQDVHQHDQNKPAEHNAQEQRSQEAKPGKQEEHAGGHGGGRIPDDRFRANFGQEHRFRVSETDYRRDRRFQYGGYWFGFVQPWPANWLYTQEVFVVEIDGVYYLCNASYPGVNVTLSVTL